MTFGSNYFGRFYFAQGPAEIGQVVGGEEEQEAVMHGGGGVVGAWAGIVDYGGPFTTDLPYQYRPTLRTTVEDYVDTHPLPAREPVDLLPAFTRMAQIAKDTAVNQSMQEQQDEEDLIAIMNLGQQLFRSKPPQQAMAAPQRMAPPPIQMPKFGAKPAGRSRPPGSTLQHKGMGSDNLEKLLTPA